MSPDPVPIATEAALWCRVKALPTTVIVSDDAGQFKFGPHALLRWVHAERLVHKFDTFTDASA